MMEWPESQVLAKQLNGAVRGRKVEQVLLGLSPHKFFFTNQEAPFLPQLLKGKTLGEARPLGIYVEIEAEENALLMGEGMRFSYVQAGAPRPPKYQLLIELEDGAALAGSVKMYGGAWAYGAGSFQNPYYLAAKEKPSPGGADFEERYFLQLLRQAKPGLSAKAFLATEQRFPGLGNGVLQDILLRAGVHPRKKVCELDANGQKTLFAQVVATLQEMAAQGGRDTERDLFGVAGGYHSLLSAKTWQSPCPRCGGRLEKQSYLGGSVYFCTVCQPLTKQGCNT